MLLDRKKLDQQLKKQQVNLTHFNLGEVGVELLCSKDCSHIHKIFFNFNQLTPVCVKQLIKPKWTNLVYISLTNNNISNGGCKYLTKISFANVQSLHLANNQISEFGMCHLSKLLCPKLQLLNLSHNKVKMEGVRWLCKGHWQHLNHLNLQNNIIFIDLIGNFTLSQFDGLTELMLYYNYGLTQKKVKMLKSRFKLH